MTCSREHNNKAKPVAFAGFGSPDLCSWFHSVHLLQSSRSNTNVPYTCAATTLSKDFFMGFFVEVLPYDFWVSLLKTILAEEQNSQLARAWENFRDFLEHQVQETAT